MINKKQIFQLLGFFGILLITLFAVENLMLVGLKKSRDEFNRKLNAVVNDKIDADLTIWGSSTALVHFNPEIIDEVVEMNAYNMGMNGSNFNQYFGLLKEYVERNPNNQHIVITININGFNSRELFNNNHFWIPYYNVGNIYEGSLFVNDRNWKVKNIPFYRLTIIDKHALRPILRSYLSKQVLKDVPMPSRKGFFPRNIKSYKGKNSPFEIDIQRRNINKLVEVCREIQNENMNLYLVTTPAFIESQNNAMNLKEFVFVMDSISAELNIPHLNFLGDSICYKKSLFYENIHLNEEGANLLSRKFSHWFNQVKQD